MDKHTKYYIKDKVYQLAYKRAGRSCYVKVREERGKLVKELADSVGVTPNHVRKVWGYNLSDKAEVRMEHLVAFAEVLGCTARDLLHEDLIKQLFAAKEYP